MEPEPDGKEVTASLHPAAAVYVELATGDLTTAQQTKAYELKRVEQKASSEMREYKSMQNLSLHGILRRFILLNGLRPEDYPVYRLTQVAWTRMPHPRLSSDFAEEWRDMYAAVYAYHHKRFNESVGMINDVHAFQRVMYASTFANLFDNAFTSQMPPGFQEKYPLLRSVELGIDLVVPAAEIERRANVYLLGFDKPEPIHEAVGRVRTQGKGDAATDTEMDTALVNIEQTWRVVAEKERDMRIFSMKVESTRSRLSDACNEFERVFKLAHPPPDSEHMGRMFSAFVQEFGPSDGESIEEQLARQNDIIRREVVGMPLPPPTSLGAPPTMTAHLRAMHVHIGNILTKMITATGRRAGMELVADRSGLSSPDDTTLAVRSIAAAVGQFTKSHIIGALGIWYDAQRKADMNQCTAEFTGVTGAAHLLMPAGELRTAFRASQLDIINMVKNMPSLAAVKATHPHIAEHIATAKELGALMILTFRWGITMRTRLSEWSQANAQLPVNEFISGLDSRLRAETKDDANITEQMSAMLHPYVVDAYTAYFAKDHEEAKHTLFPDILSHTSRLIGAFERGTLQTRKERATALSAQEVADKDVFAPFSNWVVPIAKLAALQKPAQRCIAWIDNRAMYPRPAQHWRSLEFYKSKAEDCFHLMNSGVPSLSMDRYLHTLKSITILTHACS
jgi:hypothetical protein